MSQDQLTPVTREGEENTEKIQQLQVVQGEENTEEIQHQLKTKKIQLKWRCT